MLCDFEVSVFIEIIWHVHTCVHSEEKKLQICQLDEEKLHPCQCGVVRGFVKGSTFE